MVLNRQIRILRSKKKMTQAELGAAIGVEASDISHWELAKEYPSEEMIQKLCKLFSVPREFLVGEEATPSDPTQISIFDNVKMLTSYNQQRVDRFIRNLLIVQNGEKKLAREEVPVRAEAEKLTIRCSFCGKPQSLCDHLIAGNNHSYICDDCVNLCSDILKDEGLQKPVEGKNADK